MYSKKYLIVMVYSQPNAIINMLLVLHKKFQLIIRLEIIKKNFWKNPWNFETRLYFCKYKHISYKIIINIVHDLHSLQNKMQVYQSLQLI